MRILWTIVLMLISVFSSLAQSNQVEMADAMMENGKIYVVVGVICIIFLGIVIYLIALDKRIRKIEE